MSNFLCFDKLNDADPRAVCAGDDYFALPAAVALRSAITRLKPGRNLGLFFLDVGISQTNRARIEAELPRERVALEWIPIEDGLLNGLPIKGHASAATYARLLLPLLLPASLDRVIYLDSDIVVCADLCELWDTPLDDNLAMAVQDISCPFFDNELALADRGVSDFHIVVKRGIGNLEELGLDPRSPYFNAGILLINLEGWRAESVGEACFNVLQENRDHVLWWDQYALNVVLAGRFGHLPARWNVQAGLTRISDASQCVYSQDDFEASVNNPAIIHYTGPVKPWHAFKGRRLPRADYFHRVREETGWSGFGWRWTLIASWLRMKLSRLGA